MDGAAATEAAATAIAAGDEIGVSRHKPDNTGDVRISDLLTRMQADAQFEETIDWELPRAAFDTKTPREVASRASSRPQSRQTTD